MKILDLIVAQPKLVQVLKSAISASRDSNDNINNLTHAWLFTGPSGSGCLEVVKVFAAALICPNNGCGTCVDCLTTLNGNHLDVESVRSNGTSIKIDTIREVIARAAFAPFLSGKRIIILEEAERLTESASNALLKSIEEPNLRCIWLICAPSELDVLPTVRSRCRHLTLQNPSSETILTHLLINENTGKNLAEYIAKISNHNLERAQYLARNPDAIKSWEEVIKTVLEIESISGAYTAANKIMGILNLESERDIEKKQFPDVLAMKSNLQIESVDQKRESKKILKELDISQKELIKKTFRHKFDQFLLDIASLYRGLYLKEGIREHNVSMNPKIQELKVVKYNEHINRNFIVWNLIMNTRESISDASNPSLILENLFCEIASI